ncbi:hypothetical protein CYLTODRAFT_424499 [Cylindrobasidium torrendii FP15055 ss-10]|uniref:Uncharacterized protein n=1 Tax=Cylindrobasidium torrendii FP15055 ss-10 TaxID=1314674 RepID=A0A0D7B3V8_9AGAR|nr:hypothetical protein CYLTODRAFT_424499 [Cylindrobasidium torrendii FP15055 ss-10]
MPASRSSTSALSSTPRRVTRSAARASKLRRLTPEELEDCSLALGHKPVSSASTLNAAASSSSGSGSSRSSSGRKPRAKAALAAAYESSESESDEPEPASIDEPWAYNFRPGDRVWIRTAGGHWYRGRVSGQQTRKGSIQQRTTASEGFFYSVVFNDKLRKYFAPMNGDIKPDNRHTRQLLARAGFGLA